MEEMPMTDTPPQIAKRVREMMMARSPGERLQMAAGMFEAARTMILGSLPANLSEAERKKQLYQRIYGEPLPFEP
jgi:hypothetical protein